MKNFIGSVHIPHSYENILAATIIMLNILTIMYHKKLLAFVINIYVNRKLYGLCEPIKSNLFCDIFLFL